MKQSTEDNLYEPYEYNEAFWIQHLVTHIIKVQEDNPHYVAFGDFDETDDLQGFLIGSTFKNYYDQMYVMDVKDCIVDKTKMNAFVVTRLFDAMFEHVKSHGGIYWRADSIHHSSDTLRYSEFLAKKYNGHLHVGVKGKL